MLDGENSSGGKGDEKRNLVDGETGSSGNGDEELDLGDKGKGSGGNGDLGDGENRSSGNGDKKLDLGGGKKGSGGSGDEKRNLVDGETGSSGNGDKELDLGDKEKGSDGIGDEELNIGDKGKGSGGNGDLGDGENRSSGELDVGGGKKGSGDEELDLGDGDLGDGKNGSSGNSDKQLDLGGGKKGSGGSGHEELDLRGGEKESGDEECGGGENGNGSGSVKADTGNVEKGVGNWENCKVLGDQKGGKHEETVPQDHDEPPSVGVITGVSGREPHEPHDRDPWTETLAEKKSKIATIKESRGRGKSRGRGRGKSRGRGSGKSGGRGTGKGRGRGRAGVSPVSIHPMITRHDWDAKDWRRSAHSIEGIANASRCLNYKHIISGLEASDETEDKHLYNVLKNITSMEYFYQMEVMNKQTNNVNSDEQKSDEQMGSAFGSSSTEELSKYFPNAQCNTTDEQTNNVNSDEQKSDEQMGSAFGSSSTEELSKYFPNAQCNTTSFDTLIMDSVSPEESVLISGDESEIIEKTVEVTIVKESGDSKMLRVCTERWPENKEFTVHTDTKFQNLSAKSDEQLEYVYTLKAIVESTSQEEIELTDKLRRQKLMAIPESYSGCNKR